MKRLSRREVLARIASSAAVCSGIAPLAESREVRPQPGFVSSELIYDRAPFPACHASTIEQAADGALIAAWFGGSDEGHDDVGIWLSRHDGMHWGVPVEVANGVQAGGERYACWNPVLFRPAKGPLLLFFKVGPSPSRWWGVLKRSNDDGRTWSDAERLPDGFLGPIKNKPVQVGERIVCGSSTEDNGWRVHMETCAADAGDWKKTGPLNDGRDFGLIQPAILRHGGDRLQILCRSRQKRIVEFRSDDSGGSWSGAEMTVLPNPNSGIDAVTLADGRHLVVYNHTERGRSPLNVALSRDGKTWQAALVLESEPGEYSYPAAIQTSDGRVHITYTWNRKKIRHVAVDPGKLVLREMPGGRWPE